MVLQRLGEIRMTKIEEVAVAMVSNMRHFMSVSGENRQRGHITHVVKTQSKEINDLIDCGYAISDIFHFFCEKNGSIPCNKRSFYDAVKKYAINGSKTRKKAFNEPLNTPNETEGGYNLNENVLEDENWKNILEKIPTLEKTLIRAIKKGMSYNDVKDSLNNFKKLSNTIQEFAGKKTLDDRKSFN